MKFKKGDEVIHVRTIFADINPWKRLTPKKRLEFEETKIKSINKLTYKLENDVLIEKDTLKEKNVSYNRIILPEQIEKYEKISDELTEQWNELKIQDLTEDIRDKLKYQDKDELLIKALERVIENIKKGE